MTFARTLNKSEYVADLIEKEIKSGVLRSGMRLYSIRQLCARFDVSIAVINSAYNILESKNLIERRIGSGTYIAENINNKSKKFGILTSVKKNRLEGYYESLLEAANRTGHITAVQLMDYTRNWESGIDILVEQKPAAILIDLSGADFPLERILPRLNNIPYGFVNRWEWESALPERAVLLDHTYMTEMVLRYFQKQGHRRIMFLGHKPEPLPFKKRQLTVAAEAVGLKFPSFEFEYACFEDFDHNRERISRIFEADEPPTAIFTRSDSILFRFMIQLRTLYPNLKEIENIGCYRTVWSQLPSYEMRSFHIDFEETWSKAMVMFDEGTTGIEWYRPEWPEKIEEIL